MNKIVYAGYSPRPDETSFKGLTVIVPEYGGKGGRLVTDKFKHSYGWGEIVVIPPKTQFIIEDGSKKDVYVCVEQPAYALKSPDIMTDVDGDGIRKTAEQAVIFFQSEWKNKRLVLSALGDLLISLISLYACEFPSLSPVTEQVRAEIDAHISDALFSLDDYIRKLPLNYDYIRKLFQKEVGLTPHEYLVSARMKTAAAIIDCRLTNRYSNYTVAQIAEACGFSEPLYFSRVFKKYYGVSPSEYSKNTK